jgi:cytochrome c553
MNQNSIISFVLALLGAFLAVAFYAEAQSTPTANSPGSESVAAHGLEISPIPPKLQGKDREQVGRGSYLVNAVADCGSCHTFPQYLKGGSPFHGTASAAVAPVRNTQHYFAGGRCFGTVMSTNLTPGVTGHPADLTLQQFITAMRLGRIARDDLLQVMPWPAYHNMSDEDLKAIYEYLSALTHNEPCNDSCPPSYNASADCPNPAPAQ